MNLLTGLLIGFLIAVPIGPIDLLCIRRTLLYGLRAGFITGMGAAVGDGVYAALAAFGIAELTSLLMGYKLLFQSLGGAFLCALGIANLLWRQGVTEPKSTPAKTTYAFLTTFFLVLMSPASILSFMGAFAAVGITTKGMDYNPIMLTLGVFLGSSLWWLILCCGVKKFKEKIELQYLQRMNQYSGALLLSFGVVAIWLSVT